MKIKILPWAALLMPAIVSTSYGQTDFQNKYKKEGMYFFDGIEKIRQSQLFTVYKNDFGLSDFDEMRPTNNVVTKEGIFHTKYELFHKGVRVEGSLMNVSGDKGIALNANGFLVTGLNVDNNNVISAEQAIKAAIDFVGANKYIWQDSLMEASLKEDSENPDATNYPKASLIITKKRGEEYRPVSSNFALCYKVVIHAMDPVSITDVFVHANTGEVFTYEEGRDADYTDFGTVKTWYNGEHNNIETRTCTFCFNYWLHDVNRNIYTTKYGKDAWSKGSYNKDGNNVWEEENTKTAASAHWGVQRAWDYFYSRHGRAGSDYQNRRVHIHDRFRESDGRRILRAF